MPTVGKLLHLAIEYIAASKALSTPEHCRPYSLVSYYAAMHLFEAMFAAPVGGLKEARHFHAHRERIHYAMENSSVFGSKPTKALKTLYDFSYMARYIAQDLTPINGSGPVWTQEIDVDAKVAKTQTNIDNIHQRLARIIQKTRDLIPERLSATLGDADAA